MSVHIHADWSACTCAFRTVQNIVRIGTVLCWSNGEPFRAFCTLILRNKKISTTKHPSVIHLQTFFTSEKIETSRPLDPFNEISKRLTKSNASNCWTFPVTTSQRPISGHTLDILHVLIFANEWRTVMQQNAQHVFPLLLRSPCYCTKIKKVIFGMKLFDFLVQSGK